MHAAIAISYFHRKIGPMVYYSYPEEALKEEEKVRLADIMDQAFEEGFFTHRFGDLYSLNYYFEIQSEWARGNKEMLMVSVIVDTTPTSNVETIILQWCSDFATRLKNNEDIYKAFYNVEDSHVTENDQQDIKKFSQNLHFWVRELYWTAIEELREKTEEEKWASIMSQPHIFRIIKHLSKGPLALEDLQKWFSIVFPQHSLADAVAVLEREKFIFQNTIGQETYVLLVKDVNISRSPPNCIIDLEEDSPELADLTVIYINEVREFFDSYKQTPMDSLELFKLFADPKIYNVISQLREGPLPKEKIVSMVSEKTTQDLLKNLEVLKEKNIIQEFSYSGENLFILKSDVVLTASFPEYLRKLLPKESKEYTAQSYSTRRNRSAVSESLDEESHMISGDTGWEIEEDLDSFNFEDVGVESQKDIAETPKINISNDKIRIPTPPPSSPANQLDEDLLDEVDTPNFHDYEEAITPEMQKQIMSKFKSLIETKPPTEENQSK
jgi:hypothetical protein